MDLKLAVKLLKTVDRLAGVEDLLEEYNETYILQVRKLADVDEKLASQLEILELAAPCIFTTEIGFDNKAKTYCSENQIQVRKGNKEDLPFTYYLDLDHFSFGITEL